MSHTTDSVIAAMNLERELIGAIGDEKNPDVIASAMHAAWQATMPHERIIIMHSLEGDTVEFDAIVDVARRLRSTNHEVISPS